MVQKTNPICKHHLKQFHLIATLITRIFTNHMQLDALKALVQDDFDRVDAFMRTALQSSVSLINNIGEYLVQGGGKRLRPLLALLSAKALGYQGDHHVALATAIELIHTATLLHDDVIDCSQLRRDQKTANALWGNTAAILVGDYLYSKAFQLMVNIDNMEAMKLLSQATSTIAQGEALQLMNQYNPYTTEHEYFTVIHAKTAQLFEVTAVLSAVISNADTTQTHALQQYAQHIGMAFQLVDDALDYSPPEAFEILGKEPGDDLAEGKVTLPLLFLLKRGSPSDIALAQQALTTGDRSLFTPIQKAVFECGGLSKTLEKANSESQLAIDAIQALPKTQYWEALMELATFVVTRDY